MTAQTVWLPMSSCSVSQQPSRKNPVMDLSSTRRADRRARCEVSLADRLHDRCRPSAWAVSARVNVFRDTPEKATRPHPLAFCRVSASHLQQDGPTFSGRKGMRDLQTFSRKATVAGARREIVRHG